MDKIQLDGVPAEGDLVLTVARALTDKQREQLRSSLEDALPGRKVLVLQDGMKLGRLGDQEQLARIESKLDTLIAALASDDEDEPQFTLDGDRMPPDRKDGQPL